MIWVYGDRGYRNLFLDARACMSKSISAEESIDSGVCAKGNFEDEEVNRLLGTEFLISSLMYFINSSN